MAEPDGARPAPADPDPVPVASRSPLPILALTLGLALVPLLGATLLWPQAPRIPPAAFLAYHNLVELFAVVVALSIFGVGFFTHDQSGDRHALFLACAFLAVGITELLHTLSYAGMPAFVTPSSGNKASLLWVGLNLFQAGAFLASAWVGHRSQGRWLDKRVLLAGALAVPALLFGAVALREPSLPAAFVPGVGQTAFKQGAEAVMVLLLVLAIAAYWRRLARGGDELLRTYVAAFALCAVSEVFFAVYSSVTDAYNALGHAFRVVAYLLVYRGIFVASVRRPYRDLARAAGALRAEMAEHAAAEEARRASEDTYRVLAASVTDVIYGLDAELRCTQWNRAAEVATGVPAAQALGRPLGELFPEAGQPRVAAAYRQVLEKGGSRSLVGEHKLAGRARIFETDCYRAPSGLLVVARDVTERRRMEEQLRRSQKLEAVGRLAGGVAHDFNNLLTGILGSTELLLGQFGEGSPGRGEVLEVQAAAERAAELARQLLAFGRKHQSEAEVLDLAAVLGDMDRMLRRLIGEDVALTTVTDPALGRVRANRGQVEQVVMNLVLNGRDAMPEGGRLTIEAGNASVDAEQAAELGVSPGEYVVLAVSDTGMGMDEGTRAHLFEPFFTTKEPGKGTGLGLSTVYGIVQAARGTVWVYSELGRGTVFKVYLPRTEAPLRGGAAPRPAALARGTESLLLVEDEPAIRQLLARALRSAGYAVVDAGTGDEALRLVGESAVRFDLLVTDVIMPGLGGVELARRLRARQPDLRVLLISGYTERGAAVAEVAPGTPFLQKPFTPNQLSARIRSILDAPRP